jgi:hypothetical protein
MRRIPFISTKSILYAISTDGGHLQWKERIHLLHNMYNSKDSTKNIVAMALLGRLFHGSGLAIGWSFAQVAQPMGPRNKHSRVSSVRLGWALSCVSLKKSWTPMRKIVGKISIRNKPTTQSREKEGSCCRLWRQFILLPQDCFQWAHHMHIYIHMCIYIYIYIYIYIQLLGQYKINATIVNPRVIAMFVRISRTEIASLEAHETDTPINPLW